ncbi:MAG: carbohydrate-binding domain-containing protein [Bacteroidales bacterium]|nr:carbohydrate-binding domain-containing protein [Bacteroidales bacterium]
MMKRFVYLLWLAVSLSFAAACSSESGSGLYDEPDSSTGVVPGGSGSSGSTTSFKSGGSSSPATVLASNATLTTFDVALNTSPLSETESSIPADDEDYIENSEFTSTISIVYSGSSATVTGSVSGVEVTVNGADVLVNSTAKKVEYALSGSSSDGRFKLYSEKKFKLSLNSLNLTNNDGAPINIQSGKRAFVVLSGTNTLKDGSSYNTTDGEDEKGCLFSEGELLFSGNGTLNVTGNYKHGIVSDDYILLRPGNIINVTTSKGHGLKANDAVTIAGGVLNVSVSGTAKKGISCDSIVVVKGGRTTILTSGGGEWDSEENDVTASAGIKADDNFDMSGGELYIKSTGSGGKGISSDIDVNISGGTLKVITIGAQYKYGSYDAKAKGIKADGNLTISGGDVWVRASGGEGSEGIESKKVMTISGGNVLVYTYDDAFNAKSALNITGGNLYAYSTNNDAIDSNGSLTISGGNVIASGTFAPEDGFDCDQNTFNITGGVLIGMGGGTSTPSNTSTQASLIFGQATIIQNTYIAITNASGKNLLSVKLPRSYSGATLLISAPGMTKGSSVTVKSGVTVKGGTDFCGLNSTGTVSDGSDVATISLSSIVTSHNYSGGMGGGPGVPPGGGGPGRP